jgi:hypothetical protein
MRKFTCACCHEEMETDCPEEEVLAEAKLLWGDQPTEELARVCDVCFQNIMTWAAEAPEFIKSLGTKQ